MLSGRTGSRPSACGPQTLPVSLRFTCHVFVHLDRPASTHHVFPHPVLTFTPRSHDRCDSAEWRILDLALSLYGKVVVPLYENFGPDSIGTSPVSSRARFQPPTRNFIRVHVSFLATGLSLACAKSKLGLDSINHSDLSVIFVQPQNVSALLGISPKLLTLKTIISLGEIPEAARKIADAWGKARGIRVLTLNESKLVFGCLHFAFI